MEPREDRARKQHGAREREGEAAGTGECTAFCERGGGLRLQRVAYRGWKFLGHWPVVQHSIEGTGPGAGGVVHAAACDVCIGRNIGQRTVHVPSGTARERAVERALGTTQRPLAANYSSVTLGPERAGCS